MSAEGFALSLDALRAWCDRNNITYLFNERLQQIGVPTPLGREYVLRAIPRPSRGMMTLALVLPFPVSDERADAIARAVGLANSSTFMGAWVYNQGQRELYFRVTVPVEGVLYDDAAVRFLLQVVIGTVKGLAPRLRAIAEENAPWESVLAEGGQAN